MTSKSGGHPLESSNRHICNNVKTLVYIFGLVQQKPAERSTAPRAKISLKWFKSRYRYCFLQYKSFAVK